MAAKSKKRYEIISTNFMDWRLKNKVKSFSENVVLAYFGEISKQFKASSLWAIYSMLRSMLIIMIKWNTFFVKMCFFWWS